MRTFTITFQNDQEAENFLNKLQATKFEDDVEIFEMNEDTTEEGIDAFDRGMTEFYENPFDKVTYEQFQKDMLDNGIKFYLLRP